MSHVMLLQSLFVVFPVLFAFPTLSRQVTAVSNETQSDSCGVSCVIESDIQSYGFDAAKRQVLVDVKRCVKVFVTSSSDQTTSCTSGEECQKECTPRSYTLESHSNRTGPFTVATIRRCHANTHHCQSCQRRPNAVYVFPGSKYQTRVDVGKCSGVCEEEEKEVAEVEEEEEGSGGGDGMDWLSFFTQTPPPPSSTSLSCQPTRFNNVAIQGPNGYETIEVIEECSCVQEACYRVDHFQSLSVLADGRKDEKVVNVGRCVGNCNGVTVNGRCLQYNSAGLCTFYLPASRGKCRPTAGSLVSYTDSSGVNKTIPVVDDCGCTTG